MDLYFFLRFPRSPDSPYFFNVVNEIKTNIAIIRVCSQNVQKFVNLIKNMINYLSLMIESRIQQMLLRYEIPAWSSSFLTFGTLCVPINFSSFCILASSRLMVGNIYENLLSLRTKSDYSNT